MRLALATSAVLALSPFAALAGDAAAGEQAFARQCVNCHIIQNDAGEVLAGRNARQGPNLYGVFGRQAGTVDGFRYGDSIVQAGAAGLFWDEPTLIEYMQNPNNFLRAYLDNNRARGNMSFQVRNAADAENLAAYLATFSPAPEEDAAEDEGEAAPAD